MPSRVRDSSSSSQSSVDNVERLTPGTAGSSASSSAGEGSDEYAAASFPGYAEKPLEEQLEPIAVVGMGCRLPGQVSSAGDFWKLMMSKGSGGSAKVPASRFNIEAHLHDNNDRPGSFGVAGGYFLEEDLGNFDPGLFGITPVEAMWMDPQQRRLLEVVYEAFESGGVTLEKVSGTRTGVFAASFTADWQQMAFKEPSFRHSLAATGVDPGLISNRISHVFNLKGPSMMCNTACSSSVYALHNACNALRNGEAEAAVVGGVNLVLTVDQHMNTAKLGVLSPTSTCHTFDASADGYGRADGVGAVYLKRLADAERDGDPVRGVIRSSATGCNGRVAGAGITHPNRDGQASVIAAAYQRGGQLDPRLTGYFECHGTGTPVGDPLEVQAVAMAMNQARRPDRDAPLCIGAVKPNIGHSEAASGLSALIKAVLMVERGLIPPVRGVDNASPAILWRDWQVRLPSEPEAWPPELPVRRVSINSFGYGGTNAHLIVEGAASMVRHAAPYAYRDAFSQLRRSAAAPRRASDRRRPFLLPFSAHDKPTLRRNIAAHAAIVADYSLLDLSWTLGTRRSSLSSRAFTVASHSSLSHAFAHVDTAFAFAHNKAARGLAFVFTGQGAQWARMGADLITTCPLFLRSIRALDLALETVPDGPDWSIEDVLLEHAPDSPVNQAEFAQPLCTAVQVALVQLLASWGITPLATLGHSSGEIAAAYAAGLISADEAIVAAYYRGQVAKDVAEPGAMLAVGLGAEAVAPYLEGLQDAVVVACHNSPSLVTLSGDAHAVDSVKARLDADAVFARAVPTNAKAYHSHHMAPVAARYERLVRAARAHRKPSLPLATTARMVSSVTAALVDRHAVIDEAYWSANLRSPVLFNQALQTLLAEPDFAHVDLLVELGPHSALAGPIKQIQAAVGTEPIDYLPSLLRNHDSALQLLHLAGHLWLRALPLDMAKVAHAYVDHAGPHAKPLGAATIVDLPPYQWNYTRPYWAESRSSREHRHPRFPRHDLLGQLTFGGSLAEPTWRNVLRLRDLPWLRHHHLGGESVFPAAAYFAMAIEAVRQLNELSSHPLALESFVLRDLSIKTALVTPDDDDGIEVLLSMRPSLHGSPWWDWSVSSVDSHGLSSDHMSGSISINTRPRGKKPRPLPHLPQRASGKAWNDALRHVGFDYGPTFQDMDHVRFDGKSFQAAATTNIKQVVDHSLGESRYVLHPASVDSALQLCIAAIYAGRTNAMDCGVVPVQVDELAIWPPTQSQLHAAKATIYATVHRRGMRTSESNVQMTAADGEMLMDIVNMRATTYQAAVPQRLPTALEHAPYAHMAWRLDFDTRANRHGLSLPDLVNMALFKYPAFKTAELGTTHASDILTNNPHASYTAVVASPQEAEQAKALLAAYHNAKVVEVDANQELEGQGLAQHSFDIVIAQAPDALARKMASLVKPNSSPVADGVSIVNALQDKATPREHSVQLVYRTSQASIVATLKTALESLGWHVAVCSLEHCTPDTVGPHVIMLADFESSLLFTLTDCEFAAIKAIIAHTSSLLWVTTSALLHGNKPEQAMVSGLARSLTAEQASLDFRVLDVHLDSVDADLMVASISNVAQLQATKADEVPEREFCLSNNKTYISRLARNHELNSMYTGVDKAEPKIFTPGHSISAKVLNGSIVFQEQPRIDTLEPDHVEVQVHVSGLTKEGVLVVNGSDYATNFSHEIGGVVTRVGPGVESLSLGDRVAGFNLACFDSYQQVPAAMLVKLGPDDDMNLIAPSIVTYASTLYGMQTLARVKKGDVVLVLNKSGFSGAAAVKLSHLVGAVPYAVAKTDDEARYLEKQLRLDPKCIMRTSDGLVSERLDQLTHGHGADIVFSAGSVDVGDAREAWRCIAPFGRFLDSGRKDILGRHILDGLPVKRGASYIPYDILHVCEAHPEQLTALLPTIVHLVSKESSASLGPVHALPLAHLDQAVAAFSDAFGAAKSFVEYRASDQPIQMLPPRSKLQFRPDATYLLVGCLGGLGRSLTSWMMESGARRFIFLSRSAADAPSAANLVNHLQSAGATVDVVRGDATSLQDVERAVSQVPSHHPIKGVVHAAMVLRDGLFHSMTYESWRQSTQPKVMGAHNLDKVLSKQQLDFFIMTSSVSGILGTPGQSNYAAANAYLDSLARHRHSKGNVATSAVLPMVLGVGVVAENSQLEEALKRKGMYGVDEEHLLQSFEASILSHKLHHVPDHVVVGLDPAKLQRAVSDESATDSFWLQDSRFSHVVHAINCSAHDATSSGGQSILATIKAAASLAEAVTAVNEHFIDKLARMLMLNPDDVNPQAGSIASYGIDSMIGAELRNWIFKEYRMDVPFQQLLGPTLTIAKFANQVCVANGKEQ